MSAEETPPHPHPHPQTPTEPAANKKRPRLDLDALGGLGGLGGRERKRGKSMFGLVVGTLNKAKIEDRERSASDAAKKRQLIEQRLQNKLRKETDSVRRAEEAKKDKMAAYRKEEDLQLKDSIYKFRRTHLPLYANFLLTSDVIPSSLSLSSPSPQDDSATPATTNALANPPRTHPPPLYYLPAILLPAQEAFLARRKRETHTSSEKEYLLFREERARGVGEVNALRQRVADEEGKRGGGGGADASPTVDDADTGVSPTGAGAENEDEKMDADGDADAEMDAESSPTKERERGEEMDVDKDKDREAEKEKEREKEKEKEQEVEVDVEKKEEPLVQGDDDDAVEY